MIVTKSWLQEWIDIKDISTEKICETLNAIGLEVESVQKIEIPAKVVVGKVLSCEKHPDADKLNVCQVDIGTEVTQIVCGAKNVKAGLIIPAATIGADLGNDFIIKEAKLRGVQSNGMICGATEIGMPQMNDGILPLDDSIGDLTLGRELRSYEVFNDDIIEIELTANRGDCLSIRGVARDLGAALNRELKVPVPQFKEDRRGVARVLDLEVEGEVDANIVYRFAEIHSCQQNVKEAFLLSCVDLYHEDRFSQILSFINHDTGVILHAYDFSALAEENKVSLTLKKDALGVTSLYCGDKILSKIGLYQDPKSMVKVAESVILEASYIHPFVVSAKKMEQKIEVDDTFYHTSRGSETDLGFGLDMLCDKMVTACEAKVYAGEQKQIKTSTLPIVKMEHSYIENFIGQKFDQSEIVLLLNRLGLQSQAKGDAIYVTIADYRSDITHEQDIIEEIVRLVGIDNIKSKPLQITEKRRINETYERYKKRLHYRKKSAGAGFFESVHYFFDNKKTMQTYGFTTVDEKLDITNPISEELNTLRTTLVLHLLESTSKNIKNAKSKVALFELGRVVDTQRDEHEKMAFVFSGFQEDPSVLNHGKPESIDFLSFCDKLSAVIGEFTLQKAQDLNTLFSPYEYGRVIVKGEDIGYITRVHLEAENAFGLPKTYLCEIDFDGLQYEKIIAKTYAKFPSLNRDLSLIIPKTLSFGEILRDLVGVLPQEILSFYPIDSYEDEKLQDNTSVTVRFEIQSSHKTLTEEEITAIMESILKIFEEKYGIGLR